MANNIYLGNTAIGGGIQEAPMDGKLYARINGTWEEVDSVKKENLNILLLTNQTNHSDLVGATITISYGGNTVTKTWNGNIVTVEVPAYIDYTISVSEVDGYLTPDNVKGTGVEGNSKSVLFEYKTEIVQISLSVDNGLSISSADVTIYEEDRSLVYHWAGTTIKHKVAYGKSYTISVGKVDNLGTPESLTGTADSSTKSFNFLYIYCVIKFVATSSAVNDPILNLSNLLYWGNFPSPGGSGTSGSPMQNGYASFGDIIIAESGITYLVSIGLDYNGYKFSIYHNDTEMEHDYFEAPYEYYYYSFEVLPGLNEIHIHFTPPIANGIYVCDDEGRCYNPTTTDVPDRVGVAVVTDNCCFIMGLQYTVSIPWMSSGITNWNLDIEGVPTSTDSSTIATYCDGLYYTNMIYANFIVTTPDYTNPNQCAAMRALTMGSLSFKSGSLSPYLGSAGEWQAIIDNYQTVQTALTNAGGFTINWDGGTYYWTSCEYDSSYAWGAYFLSSELYLYYRYKYYSASNYCVVPFYKVDKTQLTLA